MVVLRFPDLRRSPCARLRKGDDEGWVSMATTETDARDAPQSAVERRFSTILATALKLSIDLTCYLPIYVPYSAGRFSLNVQLPSGDRCRVLVYFPSPSAPSHTPAATPPGSSQSSTAKSDLVGAPKKKGIVMHLHGGGWTICRPESEGRTSRLLCDRMGTLVIVPDYHKAPERPFPAAQNQLHELLGVIADSSSSGLLSTLEKDPRLSAIQRAFLADCDGKKLAITGCSAGCNLAATVYIKSVQSPAPHSPRIVALGLLYGVYDLSIPFEDKAALVPDRRRILPRWLSRLFLDVYLPRPRAAQLYNPLLSPHHAPLELLQNWPPSAIVTAEHDYLCAEGLAFAAKLLNEAKRPEADVVVRRWEGVQHGFDLLPRFPRTVQVDLNERSREEAWAMVADLLEKHLT